MQTQGAFLNSHKKQGLTDRGWEYYEFTNKNSK
jgi:hypothetical protein